MTRRVLIVHFVTATMFLCSAGSWCGISADEPAAGDKLILSAPLTHSDWVLKDNVPGLDDGLVGVRHMLDMCKATGWSKIYWRCLDAGRSLYPSKLMDPMGPPLGDNYFDPKPEEVDKVGAQKNEAILQKMKDRFHYDTIDSLAEAVRYGHEIGLEIHAWFSINEDDHAWGWPSRYTVAHPEHRWTRRAGSVYRSQLSFAYPEVRDYKLAIIQEVLDNYPVDGIFIDWIRTGDVRDPQVDAQGVADYGYERILVDGFKAKYGIDPHSIPNNDPRWVKFRAEPQTEFMRSVRVLADAKSPKRPVAVMVQHPWSYRGDNPKYADNLQGLLLDVATWAHEGLMDAAVPAGYYAPNSGGTPELAYEHLKEITGGKVDIWMYAWVPATAEEFQAGLDSAHKLGAQQILYWEADYIDNNPQKTELQQVMRRCAAGAGRANSADNLLPDPSFERATSDGVYDWTSRAWSGQEDGRWSVESPGRTGRQCLAICSEKGSDAAWTATVTVQPNTFYRLSGWIKTKDLRGATGALLNIQNMQHVKTPHVAGTKDWTRVATAFRTGETTELEINCLFGGWGLSTGQAWYDDVALEPLTDDSAQLEAIVAIDPQAPAITYSPMIFGGFIEHFDRQIYGGLFEPGSPLSDDQGFRKDVIAALQELKLSIVRWPGGCFASGYHWQDGVGPTRKPVYDMVWGVEDPNTFGTDEFVEWCRRVGCLPYVCTNAGNGTAQEAKEWVEYCNRTTRNSADPQAGPRGVRYWSIGNENWGGHEIGARTPQQWGPLVLETAEMMLAADPDLKLLAAATPGRDWTLPLLKTAGDHLDYVAIHEYWLPCWQDNLTPDYLTCITLSEGPEATITRVINLLEESGYRGRIKIAFDEWNLRGWHHPGFPRTAPSDGTDPAVSELIRAREKSHIASQYTMADALFAASFLNACLRHADDVGMTNIAPIVNTRGPLYVHPQGLVKRTTFHVLAMYSNLLDAHVAAAEVAGAPLTHAGRTVSAVDAIATCDAAKRTWQIALVNRHPSQSLRCAVRLGGKTLDGTYRATVLAGDSPDAYNDVNAPDRVMPQTTTVTFADGSVTLPPHSLTIVALVTTNDTN